MKRFVFAFLLAVVLGFATFVHADLINNGGGLIYDTDLNITWYDYTYQGSSNAGATWSEAMSWASGLSIGGVSGWTLPTSEQALGMNATGSQMGHLYYVELALAAGTPVTPFDQFPFTNLNSPCCDYWSSTEYFPPTDQTPYKFYYYFDFNYGAQGYSGPDSVIYGLAVHSGDVGGCDGGNDGHHGDGHHNVPEPFTILFLGFSLVGLAGVRRFKK